MSVFMNNVKSSIMTGRRETIALDNQPLNSLIFLNLFPDVPDPYSASKNRKRFRLD